MEQTINVLSKERKKLSSKWIVKNEKEAYTACKQPKVNQTKLNESKQQRGKNVHRQFWQCVLCVCFYVFNVYSMC